MADGHSKLGEYPAVFKFYEDGKHRRYTLLFAVNGGMLAIMKGMSDAGHQALAGLSLPKTAIGMACFVVLMGTDIWVFGSRMRKQSGDAGLPLRDGVFSLWGRLVLASICLLLAAGWLFAGQV